MKDRDPGSQGLRIKAGETVVLATEPRHLHLFDHETGEALRPPAWPGAAAG